MNDATALRGGRRGGGGAAAPDTYLQVWGEVRLHFIPEPGAGLLLGWGIAGLLLLGRSRFRQR